MTGEKRPCANPRCRNEVPTRTNRYGGIEGRPAKYCSDNCRVQHFRDRRADERRLSSMVRAGEVKVCAVCLTFVTAGERCYGLGRCPVCGQRDRWTDPKNISQGRMSTRPSRRLRA